MRAQHQTPVEMRSSLSFFTQIGWGACRGVGRVDGGVFGGVDSGDQCGGLFRAPDVGGAFQGD
jgi:hypothetical protein